MALNAEQIMSTFGSFDWLNEGILAIDAACEPVDAPPAKRVKTASSKAALANLTVTVPPAAPLKLTTPRQSVASRERASSSSSSSSNSSSKARNPTHRRRGRKGKSVYRGVCVTREGKWRAVIYKERKQLYLGVFESEIDAAKAHDRAARQHFGEQAMVNFLEPEDANHMQHHIIMPHAAAAAAAASAAAAPFGAYTSGTISPMNTIAKVCKAPAGAADHFASYGAKAEPKLVLPQMTFNNALPDFAFPFTPADDDDDAYTAGDQLGLSQYDIELQVDDGSSCVDSSSTSSHHSSSRQHAVEHELVHTHHHQDVHADSVMTAAELDAAGSIDAYGHLSFFNPMAGDMGELCLA